MSTAYTLDEMYAFFATQETFRYQSTQIANSHPNHHNHHNHPTNTNKDLPERMMDTYDVVNPYNKMLVGIPPSSSLPKGMGVNEEKRISFPPLSTSSPPSSSSSSLSGQVGTGISTKATPPDFSHEKPACEDPPHTEHRYVQPSSAGAHLTVNQITYANLCFLKDVLYSQSHLLFVFKSSNSAGRTSCMKSTQSYSSSSSSSSSSFAANTKRMSTRAITPNSTFTINTNNHTNTNANANTNALKVKNQFSHEMCIGLEEKMYTYSQEVDNLLCVAFPRTIYYYEDWIRQFHVILTSPLHLIAWPSMID